MQVPTCGFGRVARASAFGAPGARQGAPAARIAGWPALPTGNGAVCGALRACAQAGKVKGMPGITRPAARIASGVALHQSHGTDVVSIIKTVGLVAGAVLAVGTLIGVVTGKANDGSARHLPRLSSSRQAASRAAAGARSCSR